MAWAVHYREFEIYPTVLPLRDGRNGIVGFQPAVHVQMRPHGAEQQPFFDVPIECRVCFKDAALATDYAVTRAKQMIDGDETVM